MTKKNFCQACSNIKHGVKTRKSIPHTCNNDVRQAIRKTDKMLKDMEKTLKVIKSGYAGVMPNGNIVDRREYPEAVPIPENPLFNTPKPKDVK